MSTTFTRIARAATSLASIGVVGTAVATAAALHSWPVVALGGAAYAALVAWDLASGSRRRDEQVTLPAPTELHDKAMQAITQTILGARADLSRVLGGTPDDVKANLALTLLSAAELETRAASLVRRGDDLAKYLVGVDARSLAKDVAELGLRVSQTADAEARGHYESARIARKEHWRAIQELIVAKERMQATLLSIAATLEALPPKIVRMRTLDASAMDALSGSLKNELDAMNGELESFEETLETLTAAGR